ncbi:biliverdin-producing heme oxygenase [Leucobacter sp. CSA1]|uniref:Biliverdin-producing heme oxygenase n=2 Tax=Leucobacter chromiisoli TaxID=2796471 RepID=A0A934Q6F0_9MICO|nr:biliverdin-producing heme oxygenase [Leucobacter chromiisoli]
MNGDHADDNLLIARAFGHPSARTSSMVGVTGSAGVWRVTDDDGEHELSVPWPGGEIGERPEIRREVVRLYRDACARLGIEPREEHAPARRGRHGDHGSAGPAPAAPAHGRAPAPASSDAGEIPFSQVLREGTWSDHSDSEGATFMEDIMRGTGTLEDYIDLVAQHFFMYEALEAAADRLVDDPRFAGFHPAALSRMGALEADLAHLLGEEWRERIEPVPATAAYAARIREIDAEDWVPGVVAHHYTRYLGDLSGGQMIARRVAKQHGLDGRGVAFYDFAALGGIPEFKQRYRAALDALGAGLDADERARVLDEVRTAYRFNTEVFVDLGRAKAGV